MDSTTLAVFVILTFLPTIVDQLSQHLYHLHLEKQILKCKYCPLGKIDLGELEDLEK